LARKKTNGLTDAELRLMEVLWDKGSATVSDVVDALPKRVPLAYSTVLTTLRILETKGYIRHAKDGRAFVYRPCVARDQAREHALSHLLGKFFGGSAELLLLNLIESKKIDAKEFARIRKRIEEHPS
jgi:predicted transcriptional regulator